MYRTTGAGKDALPPAMMAMAVLVQGYLGISDAEMVELTVVDLRVQMVLGCLGTEAPAFSQGALQEFRERLIAANMDCAPSTSFAGAVNYFCRRRGGKRGSPTAWRSSV